jgi:hypothetical protein
MVISMAKLKWILQLCRKCFYSGLHLTLECRDTQFWLVLGCIDHNVRKNCPKFGIPTF